MSGLYADPEADSAVVRTAMLNAGASRSEVDASLKGRYRSETLRCELRTLSSVLRDLELDHVDLLKIDVEGAELDVLKGMSGIPEDKRPRIVFVEVHGFLHAAAEAQFAASVEGLLSRAGYTLSELSTDGEVPARPSAVWPGRLHVVGRDTVGAAR
jgi:Methyltransferase FkbM domain